MFPTKFRFITSSLSRNSHFNILFSKPCQRQYELLPSLGVRHLSSAYFSHFNPQPCLLTDRDEMSNLHRGYSIDDSYLVLVVATVLNRSG
jgi:hypothetical protein